VLAGLMLIALGAIDPVAPFIADARAVGLVELRRQTAGSSDAERWKRLGVLEFRSGVPDAAARSFAEAVRLDPGAMLLRFNWASALLASGRAAEAETRYLEAAADAKLAPLALVNAALAARATDSAGALDRALAHAQRAAALSPEPKVRALVEELRDAQRAAFKKKLADRLAAGRGAIAQRDFARAIAELRAGDEEARDAAPADRAELAYALGCALYESGDLRRAESAYARAVAGAPGESDFRFMLDVTRQRRKEERPSRWTAEVRLGAGYDSNVPESQLFPITPTTVSGDTGAFWLGADLAVGLRAVGSPRNGLHLEYRFGQIGYLSRPLDIYSLQEHDLTLSGAWTPHERFTLELFADGFVLCSGILGYTGLEGGASVGPRITVRLGRGADLRFKYLHTFKHNIDPIYYYLTGNHDEAEAQLVWRNDRGRVVVGYLFTSERIGAQYVPTEDIPLPTGHVPLPIFEQYVIPYSYYSSEVSVHGAAELFWRIRGALLFRYEHRNYTQQSYIEAVDFQPTYRRTRIDDRFTVDVSLRRPLGRGFEIALSYTLVVNRSTIDFNNPNTQYDYDDKNYYRHLALLELGYFY
jgi:tetratricopeptide (TPR) repeat protein